MNSDGGSRFGLNLARGNRGGVFGVEQLGIGVEGHDQFVIGDDLFGRENTGAGDGGSDAWG